MSPEPARSAVRVLEPSDQHALEEFLRPRADSSIFLLANSRKAGLRDRGQPFEGTYFAVLEGGRIVGVAAHYWQGNLIFQCPERHLGTLLAAVGSASVRPVMGLLGPGRQVARAKEALQLAGEKIQLDEQEGLYKLRLDEMIVPPPLAAGRLRGRRIERRDLDRVSAWRVDYSLETLGADNSAELRRRCRHDMEASLERGDTWVLEDDGELVASTSFNAALDEVVQVGGVWTPPRLRRRGYGRAVVAASLADAAAEGVGAAVLFTGDDNVSAVKAYAALGFRRIGDYRVILLREAA